MARSETLSTWSEGTFSLTEQRAGTLQLPRVFTDVGLHATLRAAGTAQLGTYDVLITLDIPASTVTTPAVTREIPANPGTPVTRHVSSPEIPPRTYTVEGQVFGNTVVSFDVTIPGSPAQEYDVTEIEGAYESYTEIVTPESTTYKTRGFVHVSGEYAAEDPAEEIVIMLGEKEIARGYDRVPFAFTGDAADCRTTVQDIEVLSLVARSSRGALQASGFARRVSGPERGTWVSPWIPLRPYDYPATLRAAMQAEGRSGSQPNLFIRTADASDTSISEWHNRGPRATDTRVQFMVVLETGQRVRSLTWTVESEYPEGTYDFELGGAAARGFGQSYVPDLRVTVDGVDVSHMVASVSDGTLSLGVPDGQVVPVRPGVKVHVTLDGETVDSGYVVGARRPGSLSGTRLDLTYLRSGQLLGARSVYFPAGVNAQDTEARVDQATKTLVTVGAGAQDNPTPTLPFSDEAGFISHVLANSPGQSQLLMDTRRDLRSLDFWMAGGDTATGVGGLGFTEMSEWTQHYGDRSDAGLDVIEQVCAANMLSVFPLEDGNLLISDLIPAPDKALHDLIDDRSGSSAYLRFHDDGGFFVPDYRLSVPERALNLADTTCFVEVIGTSGPSQVNKDVPPAPAYVRFEKNMSPTKQGRVNFSNWSFLNAGGGSKGTNTFDFCDAQGNPVALRIGSEHVAHAITSQRGQWDVRFEFIKGTLAFEDVDNDGNEVGDNDDVTGYTGVSVIYTLTDRTSDVHIDLTFMVTGEFLVNGTWETLELRGKPNEAFVPKWFPHLLTEAGEVRRRFGFEPRAEQNPFVVSLKSWPLDGTPEEQRLNELLPDRVATGLTLREALATRATELRYCGNAQWVPNQFVAVAKPPAGGIGARITHWDVFLTLDCGAISVEVGGEINHSAQVAFLGTVLRDDAGDFHTVTFDVTGGDWFA